jgi:CubicO group peptidase (beta-lactamase class C family)
MGLNFKKPMRALVLNSIAYSFLLFPSSISSAQDYDFTKATDILNECVSKEKLAGGVVLVMKDGKPILYHATGMADKKAGRKMQKDSLFRIASQTKAITSTAILILHERGLLDVKDPVSKYLVGFKNTRVSVEKKDKTIEIFPAIREITLHDLLTHTSGIGYGMKEMGGKYNLDLWQEKTLDGWYHADKDASIVEVLKEIGTIPHDAQPGEKFVYGHSTDILGAVVEVVSKKDLAAFIHDEITAPLRMKDTFFVVPSDKEHRLTAVYNGTDNGYDRAMDAGDAKSRLDLMISQGHYTTGPGKAFSGGAGLVSTAMDYSIFMNMILNKGSYHGKQILAPKTVEMMLTNQIPYVKGFPPHVGFSYGFQLSNNKEGQLEQYGWGGAYGTSYYLRPLEGITVQYMIQLVPKKIGEWGEISRAIRAELGIKEP